MYLSTSCVVTHEQVKAPMCFLIACQHQAFGGSVPPPSISFHGDGLDIEKDKMPTGGQMSEKPADPSQNCRSLWVWAEQLALQAPEVKTVFLATGAIVRARSISEYGA